MAGPSGAIEAARRAQHVSNRERETGGRPRARAHVHTALMRTLTHGVDGGIRSSAELIDAWRWRCNENDSACSAVAVTLSDIRDRKNVDVQHAKRLSNPMI